LANEEKGAELKDEGVFVIVLKKSQENHLKENG
jgi:hypothetical protein